MSIELSDAMKAASQNFGPVAVALIRDRTYRDVEDFKPFYNVLALDLADFAATITRLTEQPNNPFVCNDEVQGFKWVGLIQATVYGRTPPSYASGPTGAQPSTPDPDPKPQNQTLKVISCVDPSVRYGGNFSLDPNTSEYKFACGAVLPNYETAMAHKVLAHGYVRHKYTSGWARDVYAKNLLDHRDASGASPVVTGQPLPAPDPNLVNQVSLWKPTKNLDLAVLDLKPGEARRYAAGEEHNARFYYIKRVATNKTQTIKGKFVWTKFAHRFASEHAYGGDYVVRKLAGDTKEWVGIQKANGVFNPAYRWNGTAPRVHFENIYVGDHEDDIEEILGNQNKAMVNYGHWRKECGYCGRNLTDAESRLRGIGPDCWETKHVPRRLAAARAAQP